MSTRNYCSTCKKQLSTGSAYSNHIKSKKHILKLLEFQPFNKGAEQSTNINKNINNSLDVTSSEYDNKIKYIFLFLLYIYSYIYIKPNY